MNLMRNFFFLTTLFYFNLSIGQHVDLLKYQAQFPSESKVILNDKVVIDIFFNANDSLIIRKTTEKEVLYLDKDAGKYSKGAVNSSYFQKLTSIEAGTFLPSGSKKYKKEEVEQFDEKSVLDRNIFFDDSKKIFFSYPNLREGAKSYLKYSTLLKTPELLSGSYFGDFAPIISQEFRISHPKTVQLSFRTFNGADTLVNHHIEDSGDKVTHIFSGHNLPQIEYENSAPPIQSYVPMIYPIINSYNRNGSKVELLGDIKKLHDWYSSLLELQDTTTKQNLHDTADSLAQGLDTELSVVKSVHQWVQTNIKYVAYEDGLGGFVPRSPQLVYERKFGDCKDMSTIQVAMLSHLGIKAHVGWVGTNDIPYTYEELPTAACDNHMIAMYKSQQKEWYVLDGTGSYTPFDFPSEFIQGKEVMVHLANDKYEIVKITPIPPKLNETIDISKLRIEGKNLIGIGHASYTGYPLVDLKYRVLEADSSKRANYFKSHLLKGSNKFYFQYENFKLLNENLAEVQYQYEIGDYLNTNNDEIYVNLNLEKVLSGSKIDEKRQHGITADYNRNIKNIYNLELGETYTVSYLPKNLSISTPDLKINLNYELKDNTITYTLDIVTTYLLLSPENFDTWNAAIKKLNKKYKEVIVLKKK